MVSVVKISQAQSAYNLGHNQLGDDGRRDSPQLTIPARYISLATHNSGCLPRRLLRHVNTLALHLCDT